MNHYGVHISKDTPITGVISNSHVPGLAEAISAGIDLGWEEHLLECRGRCRHCDCGHPNAGECGCESRGEHPYDPDETSHDFCEPGQGPHLIGSWKREPGGKYEPHESGDYAAIVREDVTQVVWSRTTAKAALCSPCFPGQGDLGTAGDWLTYMLPEELFKEV